MFATKEVKRPLVMKLNRKFYITVLIFTIVTLLISITTISLTIYFTASQELSKSFFSAHRDLNTVWKNLFWAVAAISTGVGLLASLVVMIIFHRFKRSLERAGIELLEGIQKIGQGKFKADFDFRSIQHLQPLAEETRKTLEAVQKHVQEVKGTSVELHRSVMRLNYLAFDEEEITINELKKVSSTLNSLSRELANSLKWFEI